jgi:hypothetical protein
MKRAVLIFVIFFCIQVASAQSDFLQIKERPDTVFRTLKIINIEKRKQDYIIEVENTDVEDKFKYYIMVSLRTKEKNKNCLKLKKGEKYDFWVTHYFDFDGSFFIGRDISLGVYIDEILVYVPMKGGYNVLLTPNLKGLCYTKPNPN